MTEWGAVKVLGNRLIPLLICGSLEYWVLANSAPWENNQHPEDVIFCDSYNFYFKTDYGYLKFLFNPRSDKWLLTSFKKNDKADPRNLTFLYAFNAALEKKKEISSDDREKE